MNESITVGIADLLDAKPGARDLLVDLLIGAEVDGWLAAASHANPVVRGAAVSGARGRNEDAVVSRLIELLADQTSAVQTGFGELCESAAMWEPSVLLIEAAIAKLKNEEVVPMIRHAGRHESCLPVLVSILERNEWPTVYPASRALEEQPFAAAVPQLLAAAARQPNFDLDFYRPIEHHMGKAEAQTVLLAQPAETLEAIRRHVASHPEKVPLLESALRSWGSDVVDVPTLSRFGRVITVEYREGRMPPTYVSLEACERLEAVLTRDPSNGSRCALLLGKAGVGKTSVAYALAERLGTQGWEVVEVSPADLLVGTKWLGEWETRVQGLIDAVRWPRKVVIFMPNIAGLLSVGKTSSKDTNAAEMLSPYLSRGDIALLGESPEDEYRSTFSTKPNLRRLFREFEITPTNESSTRELATRLAIDAGVTMSDETLDALLELSDSFYGHIERPGRALALLRQAAGNSSVIDTRVLLRVLNEATGVPVDLLDTKVALDLDGIQRELALRVMGQPDAVAVALDTITLVKAGLTDPERPNGVLLFVGPTGVGKTELARALAKVLFGSEDRLVRFDMSEFASFDSYQRLIGDGQRTGLLTDAIRAKPFSVLLLDEIEKAHVNIFDLCLQMFDAGRLTDNRGQTADLRNAIIILTSNVGARMATSATPGFVDARAKADPKDIRRELERTFRPEFLNRLDRIVTFQPLNLDTAERIVRREIAAALQRSGVTRRRITIDVDPAVVGLLLREGYSPAFGARPIKRAVDQLLLLPLARAIATASVSNSSTVRLRTDGKAIVLERIRNAPRADVSSDEQTTAELGPLRAHLDVLVRQGEPLRERKAQLLGAQTNPGFWERREEMMTTLDEVQRLDRVLSDLGRLERDVDRTERNPDPARRLPYLAAHHRELVRLDSILGAGDLRDVLVAITEVGTRSNDTGTIEQMVAMYQALARNERLEVTIVDDVRSDHAAATPDRVVLLVSGPGAVPQFSTEHGLHRFRRQEGQTMLTDLLRVDVVRIDAVVPIGVDVAVSTMPATRSGRYSQSHRRQIVASCGSDHVELTSDADDATMVEAAGLWVAARKTDRQSNPDIIRRYDSGPNPLVRDAVSGRSTGRLDRVLAGELGLVRLLPAVLLNGDTGTTSRPRRR